MYLYITLLYERYTISVLIKINPPYNARARAHTHTMHTPLVHAICSEICAQVHLHSLFNLQPTTQFPTVLYNVSFVADAISGGPLSRKRRIAEARLIQVVKN